MRNRADGSDDDEAAFSESVRGARRLAGVERVPAGPGASPARLGTGSGARPAMVQPAAAVRLPIEDAGEFWTARADGVSQRIMRRLRDGTIPVEDHLDLHGLTRPQAAEELDRFLAAACQAGHRCVLVIHGRGLHSGPEGPALRDLVRDRLTTGPHAAAVLGCGSAAAAHGGTGATVLYLRR